MKSHKITAKVCILGSAQSGKSTFANCRSIVRDSYIYAKSMGVNIYNHGPFVFKEKCQDGLHRLTNVSLISWELALPRGRQSLRNAYLRNCSAAFILCDVSDVISIEYLTEDINQVRKNSPSALIYIIANKLDLVPDYDSVPMEQFAHEMHVSFGKVAAKSNEGVEPLYTEIAHQFALQANSP